MRAPAESETSGAMGSKNPRIGSSFESWLDKETTVDDLIARLRAKGRRRVVRLEDFTDEEMAPISQAELPIEYAHLDDELNETKK